MSWPPEGKKWNLELFEKGKEEADEWKRAKGEKKPLRIMDSCEFVNRLATRDEMEYGWTSSNMRKYLNGIIYNLPKPRGSYYVRKTTQIEAMTCDKRTGITLVETANTIYLVSEHSWRDGNSPPSSELDFVDEGLFEGLLGFARDCAFPYPSGLIHRLPVRYCSGYGSTDPHRSSFCDSDWGDLRPCSICNMYCCKQHSRHRICCDRSTWVNGCSCFKTHMEKREWICDECDD